MLGLELNHVSKKGPRPRNFFKQRVTSPQSSSFQGEGKSNLTSSTKFFTQLQEEVTAHVQSRKAAKKKKIKDKQGSATKYKL